MARTKTRKSKYENETAVLEDLYLELTDGLRALQMDKIRLSDRNLQLKTLLKEEESKKDPNRSFFHVASNQTNVESDKLLLMLHENEQEIADKDREIATQEKRIDALHTAQKLLYKANGDDIVSASAISAEPEPVTETVNAIAEVNDAPDPLQNAEHIKQQLMSCLNGLELAGRVTGFDPERAKIELEEVTSKIKELVAAL